MDQRADASPPRALPPAIVGALVATLAALMLGCAGASTPVQHGSAGAPPTVDDASYPEVLRAYWRLDPEAPERPAWRDALVAHLAQGSERVLARANYDEVVQHLAELTALLRPEDLEGGDVPEAVAPLARWVIANGSSRGDEGRVMGSLLLLATLGDEAESRRAERDRIAAWGVSARSSISNPIERYSDLIQVWEQHEQLAPAPEVLVVLARLYAEQRDALLTMFGPEAEGNGRPPLNFNQLRMAPLLVRRAPLDVAAVYLRHGDLDRAIASVRRLGDEGGVEGRLVEILERARDNNDAGAEALGELAQGFARARPEVTAAICRLGTRRFERDPRFPLCLARVAIGRSRAASATAYYAEAIRLAPAEQEIYDEALGQLGEVMQGGALESNVSEIRGVADNALEILEARARRWPNAATTVTREGLLLSIGRAEMGAGNVAEAERRLRASIEASSTREAHRALGQLLIRTGRPADAAVALRAALDETPTEGGDDATARAEIVEEIADAMRMAGDEQQAARFYRQALDAWTRVSDGVEDSRRAIIDVRRGVLLSRLGDEPHANEAFEAALEAAPSWRDPYATMLAHLVVSPTPNVELAQRVLRRANFQLTLPREWRVYFALWVQAIAGRASAEAGADVSTLLTDLASERAWSGRLASFGGAALDAEGLLAAAETRGQRAEAHFYAGARSLASGDVSAARRAFEQVLDAGMVSFYEHAMAQELLRVLPPATSAVAGQ